MTLGSHQGYVGKDQARFTPQWLVEPLGEFDTDASAGDPRPFDIGMWLNITEKMDSLARDWSGYGRVWLNPPFDRRIVHRFVDKMAEHNQGTLLLHARTETAWFAPIWSRASGLLWLDQRVVFTTATGESIRIEDPAAKNFGKIADSGAPVVLSAFGARDLEILAFCGLGGKFEALIVPRSLVVKFFGTWNDALQQAFGDAEEIHMDELYRRMVGHPKTDTNRHVRAKVRQTLARGPYERTPRGTWRKQG